MSLSVATPFVYFLLYKAFSRLLISEDFSEVFADIEDANAFSNLG
jgi:hypothetical protein